MFYRNSFEDLVVPAFALLIGALIIFLFIALFQAAERDALEWSAFKVEHNCKVVGKKDGSVVPTTSFGTNGQVSFGTLYIPDETGWACDDGVTYWK